MKKTFHVLTYNLSWATQANKVMGSEADFVDQCQKTYKRGGHQCHDNALVHIKKLKDIQLIGLQEVNSNIKSKLVSHFKSLNKFKVTKMGPSKILTLWNSSIFGTLKHFVEINLDARTDRPCHILLTNKNIILINLHAPVPFVKQDLETNLMKAISSNKYIYDAAQHPDCKIIMVGDFNDKNSTIHKGSPLKLSLKSKTQKIKPCLKKRKLRKTLKSCCWHAPKHHSGYFVGTGDYILTNHNVRQEWMKIPAAFNKSGPLQRLFSDHTPVISN